LVIDTTISSVEEISTLIFQLFTEFSNNVAINKFWVAPTSIYPTEHIRQLARDEAKKKIKQSVSEISYDNSTLVETVKLGTDLFIWDGHKRASAAILNKIRLFHCYFGKR